MWTQRIEAIANPKSRNIPGGEGNVLKVYQTPGGGVDQRNPHLDDLLQRMQTRFESLVEHGLLSREFLRLTQDRNGILKLLQQSRRRVADQLQRRLDSKQRPTAEKLERSGIVPPGYFTQGFEQAMAKRDRRRQSAFGDVTFFLNMRPDAQALVDKGYIDPDSMQEFYDWNVHDMSRGQEDESGSPWEISLLSSLLFLSVNEQLDSNLRECSHKYDDLRDSIQRVTENLKSTRDVLDRLEKENRTEPAILSKETEERNKFKRMQQELVRLDNQCSNVDEIRRNLMSSTKQLHQFQNSYTQSLDELRGNEIAVLQELRVLRMRRDRSRRIVLAANSHQTWAMAKLHYTIHIAKEKIEHHKQALTKNQNEERKEYLTNDIDNDTQFIDYMDEFMKKLREVLEEQEKRIRVLDQNIETLEVQLREVRENIATLRDEATLKVREVQRRFNFPAYGRDKRISQAGFGIIETERLHRHDKILRNLSTLESQLKYIDSTSFETKLQEMTLSQKIMSNSGTKIFFTIWLQCASETIVDCELAYAYLKSEIPPPTTHQSVSDIDSATLQTLYGVKLVEKIPYGLGTHKDDLSYARFEKIASFSSLCGECETDVLMMIGQWMTCDPTILSEIDRLATNEEKEQQFMNDFQITHPNKTSLAYLAETRVVDLFNGIIHAEGLLPEIAHANGDVEAIAKIVLKGVFAIDMTRPDTL